MPPTTTGTTLGALLHGRDRPGLVAKTSGWIYENGGNILHATSTATCKPRFFSSASNGRPPPLC